MSLVRMITSYRLSRLIALLGCLMMADAFAQQAAAPEKTLRFSEPVKIADAFDCPSGSWILIDVTGNAVGCESPGPAEKKGQRTIELREGKPFVVEPLLGTLVSARARIILKYGDAENLDAAHAKHDFVLYGFDGRVIATYDSHYLNSVITMAGDGYFAIVGPRKDRDNATRSYLTVYAPDGTEKLAVALDSDVMPTKVALRKGASAIAVAVTSAERHKQGLGDVLLIKGDGAVLSTTRDYRYVNRLVFIGEEGDDDLLVFALRSLSRINPANGQLIWRVPQFYRLAGPFAVALSADKQHLSIVTAELEGQKDHNYRWRVHLLSMNNGLTVSRGDLSGLHPVKKSRAIEWSAERRFTIRPTANESVTVQFE